MKRARSLHGTCRSPRWLHDKATLRTIWPEAVFAQSLEMLHGSHEIFVDFPPFSWFYGSFQRAP